MSSHRLLVHSQAAPFKTHHCQLGTERSRCKRLRQFIRRWSACRGCIRGRSDFNFCVHHDHSGRYQNQENRFHCWFGHWSYIDIRSSDCIPLTGTSVNPARSLAPAIFAGGDALKQVWLFILGSVRRCNSCRSDSQSILCKCRRI